MRNILSQRMDKVNRWGLQKEKNVVQYIYTSYPNHSIQVKTNFSKGAIYYATGYFQGNVREGLQRRLRHRCFNVNNMEIIQGITEAAAELKAP